MWFYVSDIQFIILVVIVIEIVNKISYWEKGHIQLNKIDLRKLRNYVVKVVDAIDDRLQELVILVTALNCHEFNIYKDLLDKHKRVMYIEKYFYIH